MSGTSSERGHRPGDHGAGGMNLTVHNIVAVARREFTWRTRTRSFVFSTLLLAVSAVILALAPVIISYFDQHSTQTIGIYNGAADLHANPGTTIESMLNASPTGDATTGAKPATKDFATKSIADATAGRADVKSGALNGLLDIERGTGGELAFTYVTNDNLFGRTPQLIQQACNAIAIQDRLARAGIDPSQQATLFAPASYAIVGPSSVSGSGSSGDQQKTGLTQDISNTLVGSALAIFIFIAIILYGTWVAMSVVEEKSSRVMEIILGAATPFELLGGKVIGVGSTALLQYVAVMVPAILAIVLQGQVASLVMGGSAGGIDLPSGLTVGALLWFSVFFVLGFGLYAVLFAAAGSLVSRQEDVNQVIMPMTLVSGVGYFISVYAATGLFDLRAGWVVVLSHIPFLSPYLMVTRIVSNQVEPWEPFVAIALLLVTIVACVWIAARIYSAGVLMYGQKPGIRPLLHALRASR
jgi:ABC-2 type transport system permease protein